MITKDLLDRALTALQTFGEYNRAVEDAMCAVGQACGLRLRWWTSGGAPQPWKQTNGRVLYEELCAVPVKSAIYGFEPPAPPAPGRWMLRLWHSVDTRMAHPAVLAVRGGEAETWWSVWAPIQTSEVERTIVRRAGRRIETATVGACRAAVVDVDGVGLLDIADEPGVAALAKRIRAAAAMALAD